MPIIHCDGVHATCMIYASAIKENGFKLSPDDRYLGAGVYFYDKNKNGDTFANIHRKNKLKNKHCPEKDNGVLINAKISAKDINILDLEEQEYAEALELIKQDFWSEYDNVNISHAEKEKKLNRRRTNFILSLIPEVIEKIDFVRVNLPYKKRKTSSGFIVYNTKCIRQICY